MPHELHVREVVLRGTRYRLASMGEGLPVVMCHGFPGLGFSYRHQMRVLADAGFMAVAPDMLGYGGSDAPEGPEAYVYSRITADLVALLDALGAEKGVFVGHDFGAPSAWNVALRAPERVAGLGILSVPYDASRTKQLPSRLYADMAKKHFLHIHYFQEPGVAERELDARPREFLARLFWALSGGFRYLDIWRHPSEGRGYLEVLPEAPPLPWPWLTEADFDHYAAEFTRTGFRGGLAWYRAFDANWSEQLGFVDAPIVVPTLFIAGARDAVIEMRGEAAIQTMRELVPDLRGVHLLEGAGHWVQQERAEEVSALLLDFVRGLQNP